MTEALAVQEKTLAIGPPSASEWGSMKDQAITLARSGLVPGNLRNKPDDILVIALAGRELGLPPMAAINKIFVVDGKPTLSAELMCALVQREGHEIWVESSSSKKAVVKGKRKGSDREQSVEFTMEEASQAGVAGKQNWKKYPAAMLRARAISALCRFAFADVLMGHSYTPEEMGADVVTNEDGAVIEATATDSVDAVPKTITDLAEQIGEEKLLALANEEREKDGKEPNVDTIKRLAKAPGPFLMKLIDRVTHLLETGEIDAGPIQLPENMEVVETRVTQQNPPEVLEGEIVEDSESEGDQSSPPTEAESSGSEESAEDDSASQESEGAPSVETGEPPQSEPAGKPSDSDQQFDGLRERAMMRAHKNKGENPVTAYKSCEGRVGFNDGEQCMDCGWEPNPNPCPHCGSPCLPWTSSKQGAPKWRCTNKDCTGSDGKPWVSWHNDPWKAGGEIDQMGESSSEGRKPEEVEPTGEAPTPAPPSEPEQPSLGGEVPPPRAKGRRSKAQEPKTR